MENIVELQSQQELAQKIIRKLSGIDPVVLLCGDEGSGRSTVCHLVAEKTDDKMQVIFLPCNSSLSKENLRELLLQQLFPEEKLPCDYPLTETLLKINTVNLKALIIADDIDDVPLEFLREINTLVKELSGRLLFLGVCVTESAKAASGIFNIEPLEVPPLDYKECIFLSREYLSGQNKMEVFEGHWDRLPTLFKSKLYTPAAVFSTVDAFEDDVAKAGRERFSVNESVAPKEESSAKKSSKWPYLLLLLLLIGGGAYYFIDKDEVKTQPAAVESNEKVPEVTVDAGVLNEQIKEGIEVEGKKTQLQNELVISGDALEKIEESSVNQAAVNHLLKETAVNSESSDGERSKDNISAAGDEKAKDAFNRQAGGNTYLPDKESSAAGKSSDVDNAIKSPAEKTKDSFQQVEDKTAENFSAVPSQESAVVLSPVDTLTVKKQDAVEQVTQEVKEEESVSSSNEQLPSLSSAADSNYKNATVIESKALEEIDKSLSITKDTDVNLTTGSEICPETTYSAKTVKDETNKTAEISDVIDRNEVKGGTSQTSQAKDAVVSSNKSSQVKKRVPVIDKTLRFDRIPFTGEAIPGAVAEIALKDNSHYTVQVVSAYSRVRAVEVSAGVKGRYWIYETIRNNRPWYVLINGDYATASDAQAAINRLPRALKASGPFIKKFSQVKFEMDKKQ